MGVRGGGSWEWECENRVLPNLEAADEVVPSEQLKHNGPQCMVFACPIQGKDIKAPEVQILQRKNAASRRGWTQQQGSELDFEEDFPVIMETWEAGRWRGIPQVSSAVPSPNPSCLSVSPTITCITLRQLWTAVE